MTDTEDSLLEQFTCPVCFEYMDQNIYICRNGHSLCQQCNYKIHSCPICSVELYMQRNIGLEHAAQKAKEKVRKIKENEENESLLDVSNEQVAKKMVIDTSTLKQGGRNSGLPNDFFQTYLFQCPHPECSYVTKKLVQLKSHSLSHPIYHHIRSTSQKEDIFEIKLYWGLNSQFNLFFLRTSDQFFVIYIVKVEKIKKCYYVINILNVSDKTNMYKFTCGNRSKFSMFYLGRHQAMEGIEVESNKIETISRTRGNKYYLPVSISKVATLK